jgi:hypothetical protein
VKDSVASSRKRRGRGKEGVETKRNKETAPAAVLPVRQPAYGDLPRSGRGEIIQTPPRPPGGPITLSARRSAPAHDMEMDSSQENCASANLPHVLVIRLQIAGQDLEPPLWTEGLFGAKLPSEHAGQRRAGLHSGAGKYVGKGWRTALCIQALCSWPSPSVPHLPKQTSRREDD